MDSKLVRSIITAGVVVSFAFLFAGCFSGSSEEVSSDSKGPSSTMIGSNDVKDLRDGLSELPYTTNLLDDPDLEKKGIVAGTLAARDGVKSEFALRLGDGGSSTLAVVRKLNHGVGSRDVGQGFVNGIEYSFVLGGPGKESNWDVRHEMRTAAIEKACLTYSGEPCDWLGVSAD